MSDSNLADADEHSKDKHPSDVGDRLIVRLMYAVGYVFAIVLLSVCGTCVLGLFDHDVRRWGWIAGALLAAIGYPLGWVSFGGSKLESKTKRAQRSTRWRRTGFREGLFGTLVFGLLFGVILGLFLIVCWFSLALSPFTPESWRDGIEVGCLCVSSKDSTPLLILAGSIAGCTAVGVLLASLGLIEVPASSAKKERHE